MAVNLKLLEPAESVLLREGIERVYGTTYPSLEFYDTRYLRNAIAACKLHDVVAMEAGRVVGCMSTVLEQVGDVTADGSALMIAPEYRGQGIVARIGGEMVETYQRLRMQRYNPAVAAPEHIVLGTAEAAALLDFVVQDSRAVSGV